MSSYQHQSFNSCSVLFFYYHLQSKGLHNLPRLVLFTSADAHYSVKKLASFMGIGTDNVYLINTDNAGKMNMNHLGKIYMNYCVDCTNSTN